MTFDYLQCHMLRLPTQLFLYLTFFLIIIYLTCMSSYVKGLLDSLCLALINVPETNECLHFNFQKVNPCKEGPVMWVRMSREIFNKAVQQSGLMRLTHSFCLPRWSSHGNLLQTVCRDFSVSRDVCEREFHTLWENADLPNASL